MKRLLFITLSIFFLASLAKADYKLTGKVSWKATITPGDAVITAKSKDSKINLGCDLKGTDTVSGVCKVFMEIFETGKFLRDKHLHWNYLHTSTYKWSTLVIHEFKPKAGKQPFKGILTLLKESHPVEGTIDLTPKDKDFKGQASFNVDLSKFKSIGKPAFIGESIKDLIEITVDLEAIAQ